MRSTAEKWMVAGLVLFLAGSLCAAPVAQDWFRVGNKAGAPVGEYYPGDLASSEGHQDPPVSTFNSEWLGATGTIEANAAALTYPGFVTRGGSVRFLHTSTLTAKSVRRTFEQTYDLNSSVYYMAGLMSFDSSFSTGISSTAYTGFLNTEDTNDNSVTTPDPGAGSGLRLGVQWGFQGNGAGGVNAMVRTRETDGDIENIENKVLATSIAPGTHLFVAKVEPNVSGSTDRLTMWLDPTDVSSEAAAGAPTLAPELVSNWVPGGSDTSRIVDTLVFNATNVGANTPVGYDEVRFSDDWAGLLLDPLEGYAHLQEDWNSYQHLGAELRSGVPSGNTSTTDQIITGHSTSSSIGDMRAVLGFDLSSIPEGSLITDAHLVMSVKSHTGSDLQEVELWRLQHPTATMDESTVTWNSIRSAVPWTTPGGAADFVTLLETIPGFTDTDPKTFGGTAAFLAAA